jgi:hypothetical protein
MIYIDMGFRNGRDKPPTIAGVGFNANTLAQLDDVPIPLAGTAVVPSSVSQNNSRPGIILEQHVKQGQRMS